MTDKIINAVCEEYGVNKEDLLGKCRARFVSEPRQMATFVMFKFTTMPITDISAIFGRSHATSIYSIGRIKGLLEYDYDTKNHYKNIIDKIK